MQALSVVQNTKVPDPSIVNFLLQEGYPDLALFFVKDDKMRFALAVEYGYIEVALLAADALDDKECFKTLGQAALMRGIFKV